MFLLIFLSIISTSKTTSAFIDEKLSMEQMSKIFLKTKKVSIISTLLFCSCGPCTSREEEYINTYCCHCCSNHVASTGKE